MIKSFLTIFYIIFAIITLLVLFSIEISPSIHWSFAIIPLFIPIFLFINLGFLILFAFLKKLVPLILSVAILLFGWNYYGRTFQITFNNSKKDGVKYTKILTYNVRVFNNYEHLSDGGKAAVKIINFCQDYDSDIKCFQEFYHGPKRNPSIYNTVKRLKKKTPYYYLKPSAVIIGQYFGLAIFSKYPIINKGEVKFPVSTSNQAIYADIVIGKDTLRVYNVHLQSMSINENKLPSGISNQENQSRSKVLFQKIIRGAKLRSGQLSALLKSTSESPYKVVICGDLNDTPFSYTYEQLEEHYNNAFEEKGKGFGFTYNGKLNILRIDNIFADKRLSVVSFKTMDDVKYSDHYPIEADISFEKER